MRGTGATLLLLLILLSFPIGLLYSQRVDMVALRREMAGDAIREHARRELENMQRSAFPSLQLHAALRDFSRRATRILSRKGDVEATADLWAEYRRILGSRLPPHDFLVLPMGKGREASLRKVLLAGVLTDDHLIARLARWAVGEAGDNGVWRPAFSRMLGFPYSTRPMTQSFARGNLVHFPSPGRHLALYWDTIVSPRSGTSIFLTFLLDLTRLPPDFGPRFLASGWRKKGGGIGFVPIRKGYSLILSRGLADRPPLVAHLHGLLHRRAFPLMPEAVGKHLLCYGSYVPELPFRMVLALPLPVSDRTTRAEEAVVFFLAGWVWCLGFVLIVERTVFRRGPRFSVPMALLSTFLLVALLPMVGAFAPGRRFLADNLRNEQKVMADRLSRDLDSLDGESRFFHSRWIQTFKEICASPHRQRRLEELEREFHRDRPGELAAGDQRLESFLVGLASEAQRATGVETPPHFLLVTGPRGMDGSWLPMTMPPSAGPAGVKIDDLICSLVRDQMKISDTAPLEARPLPPQVPASSLQVGNMRKEIFLDMLLKDLGPSNFYQFMHNPLRVGELQLEGFKICLIHRLIRKAGRVRYAITCFWSSTIVEAPFFDGKFASRTVGLGDPAAIFPVSLAKTLSGPDSLTLAAPSGMDRFPRLAELILQAKETRAPIQEVDERRQILYEARQARFANSYLLGGFRFIGGLQEESARIWWLFRLTLAALSFLAVVIAVRSADHFLAPLGRLLAAIRQVEQGDFQAHLDEDRPDEFGSLATAFNSMVAKLREGKILQRFVSSSVQRAVSDERFRQEAQEGRITDLTVVFSGLVGFDEFEARATPGELAQVLQGHLQAASLGLERFGGEIDKVIGDKILLLFSHEVFGGADKAIAAALGVAETLRGELASKSPLPPAIGINSGKALVGILGARAFRLDFTAIGDTVNLAARLATLAQIIEGSRVVLSGSTIAQSGVALSVEKLPFKRVKGKTQEVEVFQLLVRA